jgi:hypothetical protein
MISSLPILTFHALDDQPSVTSFSPRLFRRGMARLHENGYRTLSLLEAVDCLRHLRTDRLFDAMMRRWFPWYIAARSLPRRIRRAFQFGR